MHQGQAGGLQDEREVIRQIAELKQAGLTDQMLAKLVERVGLGYDVGLSQSDGIHIQRNEPDAPPVIVSANQVNQDIFGQALAAGADITPPAKRFVPGYTDAPAGAQGNVMGNPNFQVKQDGHNTTVTPDGTIVHY